MTRNAKYRLDRFGNHYVICKKQGFLSSYVPMAVSRHDKSVESVTELCTYSQYDGQQVIAKLQAGYSVFAVYDNIYFVNDKGEPERITGKCPNAI